MKIYIVRYKKIDPAIDVIISEGRSRRPPRIAAQSADLGYIGEGAVPIVAIEHDSAYTRHQQVRPAVIVVVADRCTHRPAWISHPRLLRHIRKRSVAVVMVEGAAGFDAMESHFHALRIRKINIRPTIAVVIDERDSTAHRLRNKFCLGTRLVFEV